MLESSCHQDEGLEQMKLRFKYPAIQR